MMGDESVFRIAVVDDEPRAVEGLVELLRFDGYEVTGYSRPAEFLSRLNREGVELLLSDLKMPEIDGLELLSQVKERSPETRVVMITGQGGVGDAVRALKAGADDYLLKPLNLDELQIIIRRLEESFRLQLENRRLREAVESRDEDEGEFVGRSPRMERIFQAIRNVAPTRATVLIEGETGTGKELVARALHRLGNRADKPLLTINCAALHEGLLESELFGHVKGAFTGAIRNKPGKFALADGGTLFLDEIGDMPLSVQAKLLRVLVSGEFQQVGGEKTRFVDVRIIAATNKDLRAAVREGRFREDLYYRLNVVQLTLPPLRERAGDIPLLVKYFCRTIARRDQRPVLYPEREAMCLLENYSWPGNVRELENVVERALIYAGDRPITVADLPDHIRNPGTLTSEHRICPAPTTDYYVGKTIREVEKEMILAALERCPSKAQAARELGISVRKIEYRLKEWGQ